jgi:hypothetical protein
VTGFIYVLSSKSEDAHIRAIPDLYKIGFCTTPVKERIRNAKSDPTYLMADVKVVMSYKVGGIRPTYFENLIHKLFDHVQVSVEVTDGLGRNARPKEWFSVPIDVIEDAIKLIESGKIVSYVYDSANKRLVEKLKTIK